MVADAGAYVQMLVSVIKMVTVIEECITEEQRSVVRLFFFCGKKDSMQRTFFIKCFLFKVESVCHVKRFTTGSKNCHLGGKHFAEDEDVETEDRKWLRQKPTTSMLRVWTH
jgi:hypothetical protein